MTNLDQPHPNILTVTEMGSGLQEAQKALGCAPDASTVAAASKLLLDRFCERRQRVRLTWPYGGYSMEVAGDVVGGWHVRTPLRQCPNQAGSSIEIAVRPYPANASAWQQHVGHSPVTCA